MLKKFFLFILIFVILACNKSKTSNAPKFVVTSPQTAEIICALGNENKIVAVSNDCNYPTSLKNLPQVGMFANISIEKILNANPSLVFTAKSVQNKLTNDLKTLGINVYPSDPLTINEYYSVVTEIGKKINQTQKAEQFILNLKNKIKALNINSSKKPKVYIEISSNQLWSCSNNSFTGELIKYAGGNNIFGDLKNPYALVSNEDIINKNPDIIIATTGISKLDIINRKGWQNINAVKNGKVYTSLNADILTRAGSRVNKAIEELNKVFYNEQKN